MRLDGRRSDVVSVRDPQNHSVVQGLEFNVRDGRGDVPRDRVSLFLHFGVKDTLETRGTIEER